MGTRGCVHAAYKIELGRAETLLIGDRQSRQEEVLVVRSVHVVIEADPVDLRRG
jgi:hypothetical protein